MKPQISPATGICFFKAGDAFDLIGLLKESDYFPLDTQPTDQTVSEWLDFGCVYVDGKRQRKNIKLSDNQIIRLHTRRKSYRQGSLKDRLVENNDEFLILDKPGGLPTHPTLDNFRENAKFILEQELKSPLYTTHRLDIPTEGLLIFAKTPEAQRLVNKMFSKGRVEKVYRSINEGAVPLGLLTHYMNPESRVPKQLQIAESEQWWRCQMEIQKSGDHPDGFWHEMKLLTGKTHQIRAQMSFMGAPVLWDVAYGAKQRTDTERIALECFKLSFTFRSAAFAFSRPKSIVAPHLYS